METPSQPSHPHIRAQYNTKAHSIAVTALTPLRNQ